LHWSTTDSGSIAIAWEEFEARTDESSEERVASWGIGIEEVDISSHTMLEERGRKLIR
jgi:hypothetical protein